LVGCEGEVGMATGEAESAHCGASTSEKGGANYLPARKIRSAKRDREMPPSQSSGQRSYEQVRREPGTEALGRTRPSARD
jgi:hypothetical protein